MGKKAENILNSFDGISNVTCVSSENDSYDFEFDNAMAAEEKKKCSLHSRKMKYRY